MDQRSPRMLTYAMAIATVLVDENEKKDRLLEEKFNALRSSWSLVEHYAKDGFSEELLDAIMAKKADMILNAASIKDVREIAKPPKPHFDGNRWYNSEYSVPEEEMIWWSMASMRAPLSHEAVERYQELFERFYGKSIDDLMNDE